MPTSTPTHPHDSVESDEDWVANMRYVGLTAAAAAKDPRTPERYLLECGMRGIEYFTAMTQRPNLSPSLVRRLLWWADCWPGNRDEHAAAIAAALTLPGATTHELIAMARSLRPCPGATVAVAALAAHPASNNEVVAWALQAAVFGEDMHTAPAAAASHGSFVPYAIRLTRRARTSTLGDEIDAVVDMATSIDALFPDEVTRHTAAQLSLTFAGPPDQLAAAVHAALEVTHVATRELVTA